jgi:hypothetical protein
MAVEKGNGLCSSCTNLLYFIPVSIAQKAFDARGNGTGTPIGGGALNSGTTCRYPRFFHSLLLSHQIDSPQKRGGSQQKDIFTTPVENTGFEGQQTHSGLTGFKPPIARSPCHVVKLVWFKVSGPASSLAMALLLEYQTWCRTARSLSDAQTCGGRW